MPDVIVIAGPNGAGKSTLAPYLLRDTLGIPEYVNADTIALGLSAFSADSAAIAAGRIMLDRLNELAEHHLDFAFESTLSTRFYKKWLANLQQKGYSVHIVFLWLFSPELAVERVAARVRDGGHGIPKATIYRRYERGIDNFLKIYRPLADSWQLFDASAESPVEIAFGAKITGETVVEETLWQKLTG